MPYLKNMDVFFQKVDSILVVFTFYIYKVFEFNKSYHTTVNDKL